MTQISDTQPIPRIDYAERRRQRAEERAAAARRSVPTYALVAVAVLVVLAAAGEATASWGRIHPGVSVSGVDVGGMIPEKAAGVLEEQLPAKASKPVTVTHGQESWQVTAEEVGLTFDYDALASSAMEVGRDGNPFAAGLARLDAWIGGLDIDAQPTADDEKMTAALDKIASGTDIAPVDASVRIDDATAAVVPGKDGVALTRPAAAAAILKAMLASDRRVTAPVATAAVAVTDAEAEQARKVAEQMLSAPATVTLEDREWEFSPAEIAKWIAFERSDALEGSSTIEATTASDAQAQTGLVAHIAPDKARKAVLKKVGAQVGRPAKDATFKTRNGSVTIIPSKTGIGPDIEALATSLTAELTNPGSDRTVELRTAKTEPKITTEKARSMGINERISRYTTTYEAGNRSRVNNIHLLGDSLDGTLVAPGATFSFNGAVGQRTAEKGYQEANAIVNGKLVPQLGGGICQVGTTIFNAVFESGLPVVQRRNHSFYISHYPKGRDATVSWGGPDFKFKNDTENWVLISVSYTSSSITIALYGTDPGYDVTSETSAWRNVRPHPVEKIKDPDMAEGTQVVEDSGVDGKTITVTRTVTKDGEVVRKNSFVSVYKPKAEVVRVGTKPKVPPAEKPAEDAPKP